MNNDEAFNKLMEINKLVTDLPLFPSLGWVWTFDIIKDIFDNNQFDHLAVNDYVDEAIPSGVDLKTIFDKFFIDIDKLGIDMDMGGEILEETIRDWMSENDFLVPLEEEEDEE